MPCLNIAAVLQDLFRTYANPEEVEGRRCTSCDNTGSASKQPSVSRWPPILVVHLKRFGMDVEANVDSFDGQFKVTMQHCSLSTVGHRHLLNG